MMPNLPPYDKCHCPKCGWDYPEIEVIEKMKKSIVESMGIPSSMITEECTPSSAFIEKIKRKKL